MTFVQAVTLIMQSAWRLLAVNYPGTSISIGSILIGGACAAASIRLVSQLIGASYGVGSINKQEIHKQVK